MKLAPLCLSLLLACGATAALAQAPAAAGSGSHLCGGVGLDDQQRMKTEAAGHDLMLTFATTTGSYLADIAVQIRDSRGATVLDATCDGPIMLVDVPAPGRYHVTARYDGVVRERTVNVTRGKRPARAVFVWPAEGS